MGNDKIKVAESHDDIRLRGCFLNPKMSLNNKLKDLTIHDTDTDIGASPPRKTEGPQTTPAQQKHVFTFVTVYYKHGEWGTEVYDTLQAGLSYFVDSTASASEREVLVSLDDEDLVDRLLEIGMHTVYFWLCIGEAGVKHY
jgi:hypothetical protein